MGERVVRNDEASGSIPLSSTNLHCAEDAVGAGRGVWMGREPARDPILAARSKLCADMFWKQILHRRCLGGTREPFGAMRLVQTSCEASGIGLY